MALRLVDSGRMSPAFAASRNARRRNVRDYTTVLGKPICHKDDGPLPGGGSNPDVFTRCGQTVCWTEARPNWRLVNCPLCRAKKQTRPEKKHG